MLNALLFESDQLGRDRLAFERAYGRQPNLPAFIRSIVGMDGIAAKNAFSQFLIDSKYNATQIQFINMIIEYLTLHGMMNVQRLYESPYTDFGPTGARRPVQQGRRRRDPANHRRIRIGA